MIHPSAIMVYVGKESGYHTKSQGEIHSLLLKYAGEGQSVLRLKVKNLKCSPVLREVLLHDISLLQCVNTI